MDSQSFCRTLVPPARPSRTSDDSGTVFFNSPKAEYSSSMTLSRPLPVWEGRVIPQHLGEDMPGCDLSEATSRFRAQMVIMITILGRMVLRKASNRFSSLYQGRKVGWRTHSTSSWRRSPVTSSTANRPVSPIEKKEYQQC